MGAELYQKFKKVAQNSILSLSLLCGCNMNALTKLGEYVSYVEHNPPEAKYSSENYRSVAPSEIIEAKPHLKNKKHKKSLQDKISYLEAMESVSTPEEAVEYRTKHLKYSKKPFVGVHSFQKTHETGEGKCGDFAVAFASLLEDDGYHPYILSLQGKKHHWLYLYKINGKFGTVGTLNSETFPPKYDCITDIIKLINKNERTYLKYGIIDLFSKPHINYVGGEYFIPHNIDAPYEVYVSE